LVGTVAPILALRLDAVIGTRAATSWRRDWVRRPTSPPTGIPAGARLGWRTGPLPPAPFRRVCQVLPAVVPRSSRACWLSSLHGSFSYAVSQSDVRW